MKNLFYRKHTGYPGYLKEVNLEDMLKRDPSEALRLTVRGMLPKVWFRDHAFANYVHVYNGPFHDLHSKGLP